MRLRTRGTSVALAGLLALTGAAGCSGGEDEGSSVTEDGGGDMGGGEEGEEGEEGDG